MRTMKSVVRVGLAALTLVGACASEVTAPKATQSTKPGAAMTRRPEDPGTMFPAGDPVVEQGTGLTARGGYMVTSGRR